MDAATGLLAGTLVTSLATITVAIYNGRRIHHEVKSPNGMTTGDTIEDIHQELHEVRQDQATLARALGQHMADVDMTGLDPSEARALIRWAKQHMADDKTHGRRQ